MSASAVGRICLLAFYAAFPETMPIPDAMWLREHVSAATSIYPRGDYAAILKLRIEELPGILPQQIPRPRIPSGCRRSR
jgi:hypothetical protein